MNSGVWSYFTARMIMWVSVHVWVCVYLHNGTFEQRAQFMLNEQTWNKKHKPKCGRVLKSSLSLNEQTSQMNKTNKWQKFLLLMFRIRIHQATPNQNQTKPMNASVARTIPHRNYYY